MNPTSTTSYKKQIEASEQFGTYLNNFEEEKSIGLNSEKDLVINQIISESNLPQYLHEYINVNSVIPDVQQTIISGGIKVVNLFIGYLQPIRIEYLFPEGLDVPQIIAYQLNGVYYESLIAALFDANIKSKTMIYETEKVNNKILEGV